MLMILARLVRSESFWAVVKVRSPHTGPEPGYPRSTRCVSGFARREAAREGERAGAPVVGYRVLRLQRAGGWHGEGGQRHGWRHRLEVGS